MTSIAAKGADEALASSEVAAVPRVSVIMPCYNYAQYVAEAVRSVLQQDYADFELIIINDGSTDNSLEVIQQAVQNHQLSSRVKRVEVVDQPNQGVSAALNAGIAQARGEFVATFDADDRMPLQRLRLQAEYLVQHSQVGCVGGRAQPIDRHGQMLAPKKIRTAVSYYDFPRVLSEAFVVGGSLALFRRSALVQVGGYDSSIRVQDFQITLKLAHAGYRIDILPDIVNYYRRHPDSLSKAYLSEYRYALQAVMPYVHYPEYASCQARLAIQALRSAVVLDQPAVAFNCVIGTVRCSSAYAICC